MAKIDVLNLVNIMANNPTSNLADQTAISNFYDDVVSDLGMSKDETLTNADFVALTAGVQTYTYPTTALRLLAVLSDTSHLQPSNIREADLFNPGWRTSQDDPKVWLIEQESRRQFSLVPIPPRTGQPIAGATPFTGTYPADNVTVVFTENRADVNPWEELVVALMILVREFSRDSDHRDLMYVEAITQTLGGFKALIGME